jgi:hypothetical protein
MMTFTAIDPNGWGANNQVDISLSAGGFSWMQTCHIVFIPGDIQSPYLFSDDLSTLSGIWQDGRTNALNSQCQLIGSGFSYSYSGAGNTTLTLNFAIQFFPQFVGLNSITEMVSDQWNTTGWNTLGSFTVIGQPIITTTCIDLGFAEVGAAYSAQVVVQGSKSPYYWSLSGNLPPGITLRSDGSLTGTPTSYVNANNGNASYWPFTLTVSDGSGAQAATPLSCSLSVSPHITKPSAFGVGGSLSMYSTQIGVYGGYGFLEDSNGNGKADDNAISFSPWGGVMPGDIPVTRRLERHGIRQSRFLPTLDRHVVVELRKR